jgi:photosystem II stability/assembly factor-like uncharacterized protein
MRKLISALSILTILSLSVTAQNRWMYLPNTGLYKGSGLTDSLYRIEDMYFTDTTTGYAVTLTNRLFKTNDGGVNWQIKNDTSYNPSYPLFRSIEFLDDGKCGIVGALGEDARVLRTTDAGENWTDISSAVPDPAPHRRLSICGLSHYGDNFYGVGWWGSDTARFYKSMDKGVSWQVKLVDTSLATNLVDVVFISADTGFVSGGGYTNSVILKTTDGGSSWKKVFSENAIGGKIWKLQLLKPGILYGSVEPYYFPDSVNMVYSYDGGNTWSIIHVGKQRSTTTVAIGTQGVGFATAAKGWVGGYYDGMFETLDSGKTWNHLNFGYDVNRIFVIDSNHVFAGGHMPYKYGSGIYTGIKNITGQSTTPHTLYPISPNPATGKIKIEFDIKNRTNVILQVANTDSKTMYKITDAVLLPGHYTYYWDGSNAPNGNYLVWLGTNEIPLSEKFILLK